MGIRGLYGCHKIGFLLFGFLLLGSLARAGCMPALSAAEMAVRAEGVFRGSVLGSSTEPGPDGRPWTHWRIRVDQPLKGTFPGVVRLSAPIGEAAGKGRWESGYQNIGPWQGALFLVRSRGDFLKLSEPVAAYPREVSGAGTRDSDFAAAIVAALGPESGQGGDFTAFAASAAPGVAPQAVTPTGFTEAGGVPARLVWADRGMPVPVIVDLDVLPAGMTETQAMTALHNALDAWADASSVNFVLEGFDSFGMAAANLPEEDAKLRIQLHDSHNYIPNGESTLGKGGGSWTTDPGLGGTIDGLAFNRRLAAYVVMDHEKSTLENPVAFEEVLTHEIGHALGLAHSSETSGESDSYKREAIMFWTAHNDGRGASLNDWDRDTIRKGYPIDNLPPFGLERSIAVVTAFSDISATGINDYDVVVGDLDDGPPALTLVSMSDANFSFSWVDADTARITAAGAFSDNDTSGGAYFARARLRATDGTSSTDFYLRIQRLRLDQDGDGFADSFFDNYLAGAPPGDKTLDGDYDGDGISNAQEFKWQRDPTSPDTLYSLGLVDGDLASFTGLKGVSYVLRETNNLTSWRPINAFAGEREIDLPLAGAPSSGGVFYEVRAIE